VTSSRGESRCVPMAFAEQGVAMLSSVLRSRRAIQVNIQIMRAYIHSFFTFRLDPLQRIRDGFVAGDLWQSSQRKTFARMDWGC
jgi:hypothetical protein